MITTETDKLARATEKPKVAELIKEFNQCSPMTGIWNGYMANENIRDCRWSGQSSDGKKHDSSGVKAFPHEGASDARTFTIDDVINELVAVEFVAFWRALVRVHANKGDQMDTAAYANKMIEWMMNTKQFIDLVGEVELHSQYTHTYGWSVLYVTWVQEQCLQLVTTTMEEIHQIAINAQQTIGEGQGNQIAQLTAQLPEMIADATMTDVVAEFLTSIIPGLTLKRARRGVRELREDGKTDVPMPYEKKNEPCIRALKPWEEVLLPNDCTDVQYARVVFVKEWVTEVDLRARINDDGYDEEWVEEAVKRKGSFSTWPVEFREDFGLNIKSLSFATNIEDTRIEIVHAYARQLDEDNIPGIYITTFHPLISAVSGSRDELYAKHQLLPYRHGKMPFVVRKRENRSRTVTSSRGLPEVLHTTQRSIKVQEDSVTDNTSLTTFPPIITSTLEGVNYKFAPGGLIAIPKMDIGTGREPHFMNLAGSNPQLALEMMDRLERRIDRYSGRRRQDEPADGDMAKAQMHIQGNLISWTEAFQQEFGLLRQYLDPEEFMRITGAPAPLPNDPASISQEVDFILTFDARELDPQFIESKLNAIKNVILPIDAAGVIDRAKLVQLLLKAIDPTLAKELVSDPQSASQQIFQKVKSDISGMMLGFEPEYVEMDPTSERQLQYADSLVQSNPKVGQQMQQDESFRELLMKWQKNRQQSVVQEKNKIVGAIGVTPQNMENAR